MSKIEYKFILIGNAGVGKSSFLRKLSSGSFYEHFLSNLIIDKKTLDVSVEFEEDNKKIKKDFRISLFDTVGQEKFRSMTLNYYKGSNGIILLYDITDRASFYSIEMWIDSITNAIDKKPDSKYVIILIGNKSDLIDENETNRKVTEEEAIDICQKYQLIWGGELSVKNIKFDEINELFAEYVKYVYNEIGEKQENKQNAKHVSTSKKKKCL